MPIGLGAGFAVALMMAMEARRKKEAVFMMIDLFDRLGRLDGRSKLYMIDYVKGVASCIDQL